MGKRSLVWATTGLLSLGIFISACASRLVEVDEIEEAPKEYNQKISDLQMDVVDPTKASASLRATDKTVPTANFVGAAKATPEPAPAAVIKAPAPTKAVPASKTAGKSKSGGVKTWKPESWPYGIGEVAEYSLRYGLIEGGVVTMRTMPPKVVDGARALHYTAHVKSTRLLELFYKVDDIIDSYVTLDSHLPIRQEIQQRESAQWGTRVVTFNRQTQVSKFYATTEKKDKKKKIDRYESKLAHYAQDIFSALYFFRFIEPRERVNFAIHDRTKGWNNETIYLGTETLDLPIGRVRARHYKLNPRISGHLETKGDVEGWFADDDTRIMVRFRATIKFGSITGDLRKYQPGQALSVPTPEMITPIDLDELGNARKSTK